MTATSVGLIETVRVFGGRAPLWDLHLDRLARSAHLLGITVPPLERPQGGDDRVVRFEIDAGGVTVSEREPGTDEPLALLTSGALHHGYPMKVTERAWLDAAGTTARVQGADDAIMLDGAGRLVEATIWAIGWWDGERLVFPPLALGGLPSVARARLGELARGGISTFGARRDELERMPLVACNAARGLVSVAALDGYALPLNHRTMALARRFWDRDHA